MTIFSALQSRKENTVCFHWLKILVIGKNNVLLKITKEIEHNKISFFCPCFKVLCSGIPCSMAWQTLATWAPQQVEWALPSSITLSPTLRPQTQGVPTFLQQPEYSTVGRRELSGVMPTEHLPYGHCYAKNFLQNISFCT